MRVAQGALAALVLVFALLSRGPAPPAYAGPADASSRDFIAALRKSGDVIGQRRHVWSVFNKLVAGETPQFDTWSGEGALFSKAGAPDVVGGIRGFNRPPGAVSDVHAAGAPVVTYTLYNPAAFAHIRRHDLQRAEGLERLRQQAPGAAVPAFPDEAIVIKTAWWPVAREGLTAMPVWDPEMNPPEKRGNPYIGWRRVVAVDPSAVPGRSAVRMDFMGRSFSGVARLSLAAFHHVQVDKVMAEHLSNDPESRRAAAIALGRSVEAGDYLALVGVNIMTHEQDDWVWAALWWHDKAEAGPFAAERPVTLQGPWRNYLMQPAFDVRTPVMGDGSPHVSFNPWLEARFPDGGQGGGTRSNCMACHQRASYPATPFLPVTRGEPDRQNDRAYGPDRLRTSFLWSLPMHARR